MVNEAVKKRHSAIVQSPDKQSWRLWLPALKVAKSVIRQELGTERVGSGARWFAAPIPIPANQCTDEAICRDVDGLEKALWAVPQSLLCLAQLRFLFFLAAHQHMLYLTGSDRTPHPAVSPAKRNDHTKGTPRYLSKAQRYYDFARIGYRYTYQLIKKYWTDYERIYGEPLRTTVLKAWQGDQVALRNLLTFDWDGWIRDPRGRQLCGRLLTLAGRDFWKELGMKLRGTGWKYLRVRGNASRQLVDKLIQKGLLPEELLKDVPTALLLSERFVSALRKADHKSGSKVMAEYQPITAESLWMEPAVQEQYPDEQEFRRLIKSFGVIELGSRKLAR